MVGVRRSHSSRSLLLALLAVLALFATACGGAEPQAVPTTVVQSELTPDSLDDADDQSVSESDSSDVAGSDGSADDNRDENGEGDSSAPSDNEPDATDPDVVDPGDSESGDPVDLLPENDELAAAAGPDEQVTQVLAYALTAIEENQSYSFTQGMRMDMSMMGMDIVMGGDAPLMFGTVDGGRTYGLVDMGTFITSMFDSMGMANEPGMEEMVALFADAEIETWTDLDAGIMIFDMTSLVSIMGATDPSASDEMALFADGPVMIDMNDFDGSIADVMTQYGSGAQVIDPSQIAEIIRELDSVNEAGTDEVAGRSVTVYSGSVTMAEYAAALGQDLEDSMGAMGDLGIDPQMSGMVDDLLTEMQDMTVDIVVMIDDDGLLRRMEIAMDMSDLFGGMAGSDDDLALLSDMSVAVEMWQEFDEYGGSFAWAPPTNAVDMTDEFNEQMASAFG